MSTSTVIRRLTRLVLSIIAASLPFAALLGATRGWLIAAVAFGPIYCGMLLVLGLTIHITKHENDS